METIRRLWHDYARAEARRVLIELSHFFVQNFQLSHLGNVCWATTHRHGRREKEREGEKEKRHSSLVGVVLNQIETFPP